MIEVCLNLDCYDICFSIINVVNLCFVSWNFFSTMYHALTGTCDLAIRVATQWYQKHLGDTTKVLLVTNDRENKRKATEEGIFAETSMYITFRFKWWLSFTTFSSLL